MKKKIAIVLVVGVSLASYAFSHDLFLKLDSFFVGENKTLFVKILNGSFMKSAGPVSFERLRDVSFVTPEGTAELSDASDLTKKGNDSFFRLRTGKEGTYVFGISTKTREIALAANDFNEYLKEDGIPDVLAERKRSGTINEKVRERYSKHVKVIFQAGETPSDGFRTPLGYPVEIIPLRNPYALRSGDVFEFVCLKDSTPIANQYVMTGSEDAAGKLNIGPNVRTDAKGVGRIKLDRPGKWYVKFIQMTALEDPRLNYESQWTTLTFAIRSR